MRRLFLILPVFLLIPLWAHAEITCQCSQDPCLCFIQPGDEGFAVQRIQHALVTQGYLTSGNYTSGLYDSETHDAILRFQTANGLPANGVMDDATLTLLLWSMLPDKLSSVSPLSNAYAVWIPTDGGKKYHAVVNCRPQLFTILNPRIISVRNAEYLGFDPCKICDPDGLNSDLTYYLQ